MERHYKIYESNNERIKNGEPEESYIRLDIPFNIVCRKCGDKAVIYKQYNFPYSIQNIIKCSECGNEFELYGIDG